MSFKVFEVQSKSKEIDRTAGDSSLISENLSDRVYSNKMCFYFMVSNNQLRVNTTLENYEILISVIPFLCGLNVSSLPLLYGCTCFREHILQGNFYDLRQIIRQVWIYPHRILVSKSFGITVGAPYGR